MHIDEVIGQFDLQMELKSALPFGSGHINETFRLENQDAAGRDLLLQKINHHVFQDVRGMMANIDKVTRHIKEKNLRHQLQETLEIIPTHKGELYHLDTEGNYWRMFVFMKDLVSYDVAETAEQIYEGARSFGLFMKQLADFPVHELVDTIPDFHNVVFRIKNLRTAVEKNAVHRLAKVQNLVDYALSITGEMSRIYEAGKAGKIPVRVTHNDTKFNNVLLTKAGIGTCVIDLDTVMPGYVQYDFGDGIRTSTCRAEEDEANLDLIQIDLERFEAFTAGFLSETRETLSPGEIELLGVSGPLFAYLMGIRFLTDYLEGDVYYKIHFDTQNLQRATAQLDLCRKMLDRMPELERIIKKYT